MQKQLAQVKEFMQVMNQPFNQIPTLSGTDVSEKLRIDLMREEVEKIVDGIAEHDLLKITDGICDLLYVVYGTALVYGLQKVLEDCFDEIHRSNMTKLHNGKPIYDTNKKLVKSPNYEPPNLQPIIYRDAIPPLLRDVKYEELPQVWRDWIRNHSVLPADVTVILLNLLSELGRTDMNSKNYQKIRDLLMLYNK